MTLGKISKRNNEKTNSTITVYSTYLNLTTTAPFNSMWSLYSAGLL